MWTTVITIFGLLFGFLTTTLGAATVFAVKREFSSRANAFLLGMASGIMLAASVWSLLLPAIEQSMNLYVGLSLLPVVISLFLGGGLLVIFDKMLPQEGFGGAGLRVLSQKETRRYFRMFLAITLHNIPEGLAVGFAFGIAAYGGTNAAYGGTNAAFVSALALAVGIGIQNFPEGAAISLPTKPIIGAKQAFLFGALSGIVEPIFGVIGYFLARGLYFLQPWFLSFAAGAMIFVSAQDLIPSANRDGCEQAGAWGVLTGFAVMMVLDVMLG